MTTYLGLIRAVIVDNDESELKQLTDGMHEAHIPVLPLRYSIDSGVIGVPDRAALCIRMLFVDMNLADSSAPSAKDIAPTIAEVISKVVPSNNGPYALIFWSKHRHLVDDVMAILGDRHSEIPMPIVVDALDKSDFKIPEDEGVRASWLEKMKAGIDAVVKSSNQLTALMAWEREIGVAASATLDAITNILQRSKPWDVKGYADNLSDILGRIAQEATGKKNASERPEEAIHLGLHPILIDNLERNVALSRDMRDVWSAAMPRVMENEAIKLNEDGAVRRLNTFYCVSPVVVGVSKTDRGAFVELSNRHLNDDCFKYNFGRSVNELSDEFVSVSGLSNPEKRRIRNSIRWGFIETSADCDHAQKKARLYRYVLAAIVPCERKENVTFVDSNGMSSDRRHNAIYRMPDIDYDGEPVVLFANFRYLMGLAENSDILGDVKLRIRSGIMAELIHSYSRYIARPGVVSFAP
ncbi:hypothetical protein [Burkholderia cepacia]|uniref:hypothetical protein n=1 Tax=Burkholderia cepacia TaxID=292 RepID=UPI00158A838D|nr:hypothetical protein [Burkholderia cepacia]MDN7899119.1 hypothetical protein [Burkholderia cepacia]